MNEIIEMITTARGPRCYSALCVVLQNMFKRAVGGTKVQRYKGTRYIESIG